MAIATSTVEQDTEFDIGFVNNTSIYREIYV